MRAVPPGAVPRPGTVVSVVLLLIAGLAGCVRSDAASAQGGPPIPTFAAGSGSASSTVSTVSRSALLPQDCDQVLSHEQVPALLGLPLDSVDVHTTIGVPEPNVKRLERVTCQYDRIGAGSELLEFTMSAYADAAAARDHTAINLAAESQSAGQPGDPSPIGAAAGTYFVDGAQRIIVLTYGRSALSLVLQHGIVADDIERSVVVDLAQRVLPALAT